MGFGGGENSLHKSREFQKKTDKLKFLRNVHLNCDLSGLISAIWGFPDGKPSNRWCPGSRSRVSQMFILSIGQTVASVAIIRMTPTVLRFPAFLVMMPTRVDSTSMMTE